MRFIHLSVTDPNELRVYIGDHNLDNATETNSVIRRVQRYISHPGFNLTSLANDIAVVQLDSPVAFQSNIQPICLPPPNLNLENQQLTVTGWGSTQAGQ